MPKKNKKQRYLLRMMFKKKYLLVFFFLIIIFQALLYTNNTQNTSFRFLKWSVQEVSMGKLLSISFFSGLLMSALLNSTNISYEKNDFENIEENYEHQNNETYIKSNVEIPPQRDVREAQPTISVNYRVVKNTEENNLRSDENYSNKAENKDDWNYSEDDYW